MRSKFLYIASELVSAMPGAGIGAAEPLFVLMLIISLLKRAKERLFGRPTAK